MQSLKSWHRPLEIWMKHVVEIVEIEAKGVGEACDSLTNSQTLTIWQIVGECQICNSAKYFL